MINPKRKNISNPQLQSSSKSKYPKQKNFFFNVIFFVLFFQSFTKETKNIHRKLFSNFNKITLIIKGSGCNPILNLHEIVNPDKIIINGIEENISTCNESIDINKFQINLGNQTTKSKVELIWDNFQFTNLKNLFSGISNIIEVDLSELDSNKITSTEGLFKDCKSLNFINLSNKFNTSNVNNMTEMFSGCESLIYLDLSNIDTSNTKYMANMFKNCYSLIWLNSPNLISQNTENLDNIFKGCSKLEYLNLNNSNDSNVSNLTGIFSEINNDAIICINFDTFNIISEINKNENLIINCNKSWNDYLENEIKNYLVYFNNNSYDTIFDCSVENFFRGICEKVFIYDEERNEFIEEIINKIQNQEIMDMLNEVVKENKILVGHEGKNIYQLSTIENQMTVGNYTIIDFGHCSQELKAFFHQQKLIIFKVERFYEGFKIPIINYNIFTEDGKGELDINACKELPKYLIPVSINENELYKYDSNNDYYKKECIISTSEFGTDITMYDRKNDFNEKHLSLCEYDCSFIEYNFNNSKVKCECPQKDIRSPKLNEFFLEKNTFNFNVMKCYKLLISKDNLITNPGFYIISLIFLLLIICCIIIFVKGYNSLKNKFEEIIKKKFNIKMNSLNKNSNNKNINNNKCDNNIFNNKDKKFIFKKGSQLKPLGNSRTINIESSNKSNVLLNKDEASRNKINKINNKGKTNNISKKIIKATQNVNIKKTPIYTEFELFFLPYDLAVIYDKRSFIELYCTLIKMNQLIIFSFFNNKDNNLSIIKKYILFFSFGFNYTINTFFFNDEVMHQIYLDEGKYNIIYQSKFILYSTIISSLITKFFIKIFIMTEDDFISIKLSKKINKAKKVQKGILRNLLIKNIIFFFINFILLSFFCYYLTCFNALYKNTQIYLLKNTAISFIIFLIYPFVISVIIALMRKDALSKQKKKLINKKMKNIGNKKHKGAKNDINDNLANKEDREYTYNISQLLQWL